MCGDPMRGAYAIPLALAVRFSTLTGPTESPLQSSEAEMAAAGAPLGGQGKPMRPSSMAATFLPRRHTPTRH